MIVNQVRGDIFLAPQRYIVFAINTEGCNNFGFARAVSRRVWPALSDVGEHQLGDVLSHRTDSKTYLAFVCHSLDPGGWNETPRVVRECLDSLDVPEGEEIAVVLMGSGPVGMKQGADVAAILSALALSKKNVIVYTL